VLIFLGSTFYQISQVFYNALLITVAPQPLIGRISGLGWGAAYLGGLVCLVITLFFLMPQQNLTPLAMTQGVSQSLLLVALWYTFFALPLVVLLKEGEKKRFSFRDVKQGINQLMTTLGCLKEQKTLVGFLIAYFFYSDAIATIMSFGGIFAATVLGFSLYEVILFAIVINCVAGVGAMIFGMIDDRIGPSRLILYSLCACLLASIMVLSFQTREIFWVFGCFLGIFIGPIQSASRSMFSQIVDQEQITEMFGLYALTGKLSTFIGPLCISLITHFFRARTAGMFVVVVMFAIGLILMSRFFHLKFKKSFWDLMKWW
jgi:UMF1 family MFS transporter